MGLRQRAGLVAAVAAILYFFMSLTLLAQSDARHSAQRTRVAAQQVQLEAVSKRIAEISMALSTNPNAEQQAKLDDAKRTIAETEALLVQLDATTPQAGALLRAALDVTPGVRLLSLNTLPSTVVFQSKAVPVTAAQPVPAAKDPAPKPEIAPRPPRAIYRTGVEVGIAGNYLALLDYLEKLQNYPGRLYWTGGIKLQVQTYPSANLKVTLYTLGMRPSRPLG
jgi:MSHA biogenesis protein MshJ